MASGQSHCSGFDSTSRIISTFISLSVVQNMSPFIYFHSGNLFVHLIMEGRSAAPDRCF